MPRRDLATYHFEHVRNIIFTAVLGLWRRRQDQGMKQVDLAKFLERDPAWVSRSLRGPGNWTLRTFGELVAAMDGDIEVIVRPAEDVAANRINYDAYKELDHKSVEKTQSHLGSVKDALHKSRNEINRTNSENRRLNPFPKKEKQFNTIA